MDSYPENLFTRLSTRALSFGKNEGKSVVYPDNLNISNQKLKQSHNIQFVLIQYATIKLIELLLTLWSSQ